jgi:RNA polymerase sigma-70 factor, ECF subfamily
MDPEGTIGNSNNPAMWTALARSAVMREGNHGEGASDDIRRNTQRAGVVFPPGIVQNDAHTFNKLFAIAYNDLRALARRYLAREQHARTLQPTALVNEAYLALANQRQVGWKNRTHLVAIGAMAMRRILLNHAVARKRAKRGGDAPKVPLRDDFIDVDCGEDVFAVREALEKLWKLNERHARLVELHFFGGLNIPDTATVLGVSTSTLEKDWRFCSAWLKKALRP